MVEEMIETVTDTRLAAVKKWHLARAAGDDFIVEINGVKGRLLIDGYKHHGMAIGGDYIHDDVQVEVRPKMVVNYKRVFVFAAGSDEITQVVFHCTDSTLNLIGRVAYWAVFLRPSHDVYEAWHEQVNKILPNDG
jgi:hypothetical protein